jgi:hypothetical protein
MNMNKIKFEIENIETLNKISLVEFLINKINNSSWI